MVRDADEFEQELDLEMCQKMKYHGFAVEGHNLKFFTVLLSKRTLVYAFVLAYWNWSKSSRLLRVPFQPYLAYYSDVLFRNDDCNF